MNEQEFANAVADRLVAFVSEREQTIRAEMRAEFEAEMAAQHDALTKMARAVVAESMAAIPAGPKGDPGERGADAHIDQAAVVAEVLAQIPAPVPPVIDYLAIAQGVASLIPTPRDGRDGIASHDEIVSLVRSTVAEVVPAEVDRKVTEVFDAHPLPEYKGVWKEGTEYRAGAITTWAGSAWVAKNTTEARPGEQSRDWILMVKRGRDGKDTTPVQLSGAT